MFISAHLVIMYSREWCATHISVQGNPFTKQLIYIQVQRSSKWGPVKLGHSISFSRKRRKSTHMLEALYNNAYENALQPNRLPPTSYVFPALTFAFLCAVVWRCIVTEDEPDRTWKWEWGVFSANRYYER